MKHQRSLFLASPLFVCIGMLLGSAAVACGQSIQLSDSQAERIGRRLWQNESGGTIAGLTAWNFGEDFASLGIGHFIWYPAGKRGRFEESFPPLLQYLISDGLQVPAWLRQADACPWSDRAQFLADQQSPRMKELRSLSGGNDRLSSQICRASDWSGPYPRCWRRFRIGEREKVRENFYRVAGEPEGLYALVDYVNFKGEGTLPSERYHGEAGDYFRFSKKWEMGRRVRNSAVRRTEY